MSNKLAVFFLCLLVSGLGLAQPTRNKSNGYDKTDGVIKEKLYQWGERIDATKGNALRANKDIWYNKYTEPRKGYVEFWNGDIVEGEIVRRKYYNKASFTKIAKEGGGKMKDPNGYSSYSVKLLVNGDTLPFAWKDVKSYQLDYTFSDYEPGSYQAGLIYLTDGTLLQGYLKTNSYKSPYETLNYYGRVYFAPSITDQVELYHSDEIEKIFTTTESKESRELYKMDGWLIALDEYKASFTKSAKANKFEAFKPGEVYMQNGQLLKGEIALDMGKKKVNAFYINTGENEFRNLNASGVGCIKIEGKEGTELYVPQHGVLRSYSALMKKWEKKNEVNPGKIVFQDGKEIVGKIVMGRDKSNTVKSYQNIITLYLIPEGEDGFVKLFEPGDDIDYAEITVDGKLTKYAPIDFRFVDYKDFVKALEDNNSKKLTQNLQPGYIMMKDGTKKVGRIAATKYKISYIGDGNSLEQYVATDVDKIDYYVQTINDIDRKFVPMQRHPSNAGLGLDFKFVEILSAYEAYSYYENPLPTNVREGLTKFVGNAADAAGDQLSQQLTKIATEAAMKEAYNESGGDLGKTLEAGQKTSSEISRETQGIIKDGEGALYFEEWVIIDNETGEKQVLYARNNEIVMNELLAKCAKSSGLSGRQKKNMVKLGNIHETMKFMNACK